MSSMRNAVQRRNHKERAQPKEREKWGILEKHKDYSLRAKDYNEKKARLKILRQKAAERNPDEFYFGMHSSQTHDKGQKLASRGNAILSHEAARLLKTQDAGYLRTMAQQTRRARERLEKGYVMNDVVGKKGVQVRDGEGRQQQSGSNKKVEHIVFVGNKEEQKRNLSSSDGRMMLQQPSLSPKITSQPASGAVPRGEGLENSEAEEEAPAPERKPKRLLDAEAATLRQARIDRKRRKREREAQLSRLNALRSREKELLVAEQELAHQRAKMSNSIGGVNKAGVKFKIRERKR